MSVTIENTCGDCKYSYPIDNDRNEVWCDLDHTNYLARNKACDQFGHKEKDANA